MPLLMLRDVKCLPLLLLLLAQPAIAAPTAVPSVNKDRVSERVIDTIVAEVEGEPLTLVDLRHYMESVGEVPPAEFQLDGGFETKRYVKDMVMSHVLEREAREQGIEVKDEEIDLYIEQIKRQNQVDDEGLKEVLAAKGFTLDSYKQQIRSEIIRTRVVSSNLGKNINVLDEDVERYVEENPEVLPDKTAVQLQQIIIRVPEEASQEERDALRTEAAATREKITLGEDFAKAGGRQFVDLGFVKPDELREELREAIAVMPAGEVSEVIESREAFSLLRYTLHDVEEQGLDEDTKEAIKKKIYDQKLQQALDKFFSEELPKKYHVEMKL